MNVLSDFLQAWRGLRNSPGFLLLASGVLAVGLAATIFMYGVTYTLLDKPPPYPQADRLVGIRYVQSGVGGDELGFSYLDYLDIRSAQKSFDGLVGWYNGTMTFTGGGRPERVSGGFATEGFLRLLRVQPVLGRDFRPEDHVPGAMATVILTHKYWRTRFNEDPGVIGRAVRVNGEPAVIIGVLGAGVDLLSGRDMAVTAIRHSRANARRGDPKEIDMPLFGRLRDGVTLEQARAEIDAIAADLARRYPATNGGKVPWVATVAHSLAGKDGVQIISLLFFAVWSVLIIACANVANLLFVRANQRAYESSMRAALGASRLRLVSLTLAESVIVAAAASLLGLLLAALGLDLMQRAMHSMFEDIPGWWDFAIDWRVVTFAVGAALLSGILAGIWPALRASRPDVMQVLRDGGRSGTGLRLSYFTSTMVVVEVALAVAMLGVAGLVLRTVLWSVNADIGISNQGVMTGRVMLPESGYDQAARNAFWPRLVDGLGALPEVQAAFATDQLPGTGGVATEVVVEGRRYAGPSEYPRIHTAVISQGFFAAVQRNLLSGREFTASDREGTLPVAIVNQHFADQFFPDGQAIGRRVRINPADESSPWLTVIGVAPNIRYDVNLELPDERKPTVFTSLSQFSPRFVSIAVRGSGDPRRFTNPMRDAVARQDAELPMYFIGTLAERQAQGLAGIKIISTLFSVFGVIAVILAAAGLYGILAFTTSRRVREIGIRRSLGASDRHILRSVLRGAMLQLSLGLGIGAVLAGLLISVMPNFVTSGRPYDLRVFGAVLLLISVCALLASWVPVRRALRIQPAVALRYE